MELLSPDCKPYKPGLGYGMFGYKGASIDAAIARDDVVAIRRAHELEWIDADTRTFMNDTLRQVAMRKGAAKVNALLTSLGYPA